MKTWDMELAIVQETRKLIGRLWMFEGWMWNRRRMGFGRAAVYDVQR